MPKKEDDEGEAAPVKPHPLVIPKSMTMMQFQKLQQKLDMPLDALARAEEEPSSAASSVPVKKEPKGRNTTWNDGSDWPEFAPLILHPHLIQRSGKYRESLFSFREIPGGLGRIY
jgi:hypothetical protein